MVNCINCKDTLKPDCFECIKSLKAELDNLTEAAVPYSQQIKQLQTENKKLKEALVDGTPFPLRTCLSLLHGAAVHLMVDHSCDIHGYEGITIAYQKVPELLRKIEQALMPITLPDVKSVG